MHVHYHGKLENTAVRIQLEEGLIFVRWQEASMIHPGHQTTLRSKYLLWLLVELLCPHWALLGLCSGDGLFHSLWLSSSLLSFLECLPTASQACPLGLFSDYRQAHSDLSCIGISVETEELSVCFDLSPFW